MGTVSDTVVGLSSRMQNPNEDTEWNDVLRAKGIIPDKPKEAEVNEDDIIKMLEDTIKQKSGIKDMADMDLDELDELEDDEEEAILLQMRNQRIAEMKARQAKKQFGSVREITAVDYVQELNKFIKAISTTCIPNYPDKNLPTIFVYHEGKMKGQLVGPEQFRGMNLTQDEFEYLLGQTKAIETTIKDDPKPKVKDLMMSSLRGNQDDDDLAEEGDWVL